jgi:hypothetical protein
MNTTTISSNLSFKKTKAEIIQRLLEEKHISVEEAMTLIMSEEKNTLNVPTIPTLPANPYYPPFQPSLYVYYTTTMPDSTTLKVPFGENQIQK